MAYLKTHYPLEYFTVLLSSNDNSVDKIALYIQSARGHGLNVAPPSINESEFGFTTKNKSIIFGLNAIKGIGKETITKILTIRNNQPKQNFSSYLNAITSMANNSIGVKSIETLIKAGSFDNLLESKSRA
jgi:DNA polymerase-3 subunit alpha